MKIQYVIAMHLMKWLANFYDFRFKWNSNSNVEHLSVCSRDFTSWFCQSIAVNYIVSYAEWKRRNTNLYMYIFIYTYEVHTISFQTFFVRVFKIVVDSWKFTMLLLYTLCDDWLIFMISDSNELIQQQLEYTLLMPDCHSWWISKMQSGRE